MRTFQKTSGCSYVCVGGGSGDFVNMAFIGSANGDERMLSENNCSSIYILKLKCQLEALAFLFL